MTDKTNPLLTTGGPSKWAGGTQQAAQQLHAHVAMLNGKPWTKARQVEYFVVGDSPHMKIDSRFVDPHAGEPRCPPEEARAILRKFGLA